MPPITLEQALYRRPDRDVPQLVARSSAFDDAWLAEAEQLVLGFGDRPHGMRCPPAVFGLPLTKTQVAIVRVQDDDDRGFPVGLRFHFLVAERKIYEAFIRDPFLLAQKIEPTWDANETLPALMIPAEAFVPRRVDEVQAVLKRVKAAALKEGEDPEAPDFERTIENSESPALLGGVQILVDSGRLVFERPGGDLPLAAGLWLLLPERTRCRLWPTSFAFSRELEFDLLIVPQVDDALLEGYTNEEQASGYPAGAYELALQRAAEAGDQRELDAVFSRRDSHQTIRLAIALLVLVSVLVLIARWPDSGPTPAPAAVHHQKAAFAAGIVAVGDPWADLGMLTYWHMRANPPEKRDAE
jgi:hypothetical protein